MDLPTALERLANYRSRNSRASQEIFESGVVVFRNDALHKLGDDSWAFLEQLTLAAIDVGRLDVAEGCIKHLADKFPGSPRVEVLEGIYIEASQSAHVALEYYDKTLEADPANAAAWKRKISVLRRTGKIEHAVTELSEFLDTFYTDVEGWVELADIYSSCNQYTHALQSLQHVLLLAPQNPFYVLQAAETAYTAGDLPLAIKFFLVVVDMTDEDGDRPAKDSTPTGITVRAWYGVELCARRLQKNPKLASSSPSQTPAPAKLGALEKLAKDMLRKAYSSQTGKTVASKEDLERWLGDA
ncbi:TPR-like protein [Dentipellis sp. KUC8613]|nr:TPR-like protein [Dentipellis sp. KUC8613]